jgi:hypothetical protein
MAEGERPFLEEVLDFALYAPVGLALTIAEDLPSLVTKGRNRIAGQVAAARFVSRLALRGVRRRVDTLLETPGDSSPRATVTTLRPEAATQPSEVAPTDALDDAAELPIPGYDSLAASQIVARLATLSEGELDILERHELAGRARRTVLNRIAQLRA